VELGYHRLARYTCAPDQEVLYWIDGDPGDVAG
jgi:hypothetical protein